MLKLTHARLSGLLVYSEASGCMYWREEKWAGFKGSVLLHAAGQEAGCVRADGRFVIRVDGKLYLRSRLVWFWNTGEWPTKDIDHMDGNVQNDRFGNLRDVTRTINNQNKRTAAASKKSCQFLGVYANPRNKTSPWRALINVDGRDKYLGVFKTPELAHEAYLSAKRTHHEGCLL